jgi:hypothetical protein
MPTLDQVLRTEQEIFSTETRIAQCPPYIAINDLDELCRTPSILRYQHPAHVEPLSNEKQTFILVCPSLGGKTLWVETSNNNYRRAYLNFLKSAHALDLEDLPSEYDVDHLYNQSRAQAYALRYLRVALVNYRANRTAGAGYEKSLTTNEALRKVSDRKIMDAVSNMKYFGFLSPSRSNPRESEIEAYINFAASKLGLDPLAEKESIRYLLKKASVPWARNM